MCTEQSHLCFSPSPSHPSSVMASLLNYYGLDRNPFVDRTAEKTDLEEEAMYLHSDLQGFKPSDPTYLFFGKRGSGKTTIRVQVGFYGDYDVHKAASLVIRLSRRGCIERRSTPLVIRKRAISTSIIILDLHFQ